MAGVFFIAFIIAEVLLVVLTFTKFGEKAAWLKNRALIRAAETLLILGIVLVPATHMKWRFIIALFIIGAGNLFPAGVRAGFGAAAPTYQPVKDEMKKELYVIYIIGFSWRRFIFRLCGVTYSQVTYSFIVSFNTQFFQYSLSFLAFKFFLCTVYPAACYT